MQHCWKGGGVVYFGLVFVCFDVGDVLFLFLNIFPFFVFFSFFEFGFMSLYFTVLSF